MYARPSVHERAFILANTFNMNDHGKTCYYSEMIYKDLSRQVKRKNELFDAKGKI